MENCIGRPVLNKPSAFFFNHLNWNKDIVSKKKKKNKLMTEGPRSAVLGGDERSAWCGNTRSQHRQEDSGAAC